MATMDEAFPYQLECLPLRYNGVVAWVVVGIGGITINNASVMTVTRRSVDDHSFSHPSDMVEQSEVALLEFRVTVPTFPKELPASNPSPCRVLRTRVGMSYLTI